MVDGGTLGAVAHLQRVLQRNRSGERQGVYSVCCAHPLVIRAALELARDRRQLAVIESTCNQVNQDGGYTGLTPAAFAGQVRDMARAAGLADDRLVLGGDHLGPQPWRKLPAAEAMARAVMMVEAYAAAGYGKLHLDCSMACADDPEGLDDACIAERATRLAVAAEAARDPQGPPPVYIVGTEVPAPGGMGEGHAIVPTAPQSVRVTWDAHAEAFARAGLSDAASRIVGVVVQPGLDFGNEEVVRFAPEGARELSAAVQALPQAVYEAHSTDYQPPEAFLALVDMNFAILKVGPAATFALREAVYALDALARELPGGRSRPGVQDALEAAMLRDPSHWAGHYSGTPEREAYLRHFSYSDRLRYYWTVPAVEEAVDALLRFLQKEAVPIPLVSQYLPQHARAVADGALAATPEALCVAHVQLALTPYADACGVHVAQA